MCIAWNQNEFSLQDCYLWSVFSTALSHGIKCWKILKSQMWEILKKQSCRNFCQFLVNFWIDIFCLYSQPRDQMLEKMKTALLCSSNFCEKHFKCNRILPFLMFISGLIYLVCNFNNFERANVSPTKNLI